MTVVLAAIDTTPSAVSVVRTAQTLADLLDVSTRVIHVREHRDTPPLVAVTEPDIDLIIVDGDPIDEIIRASAAPDVVLTVIGARGEPAGPRPAGHTALSVVERADKPVVLVAPGTSVDAVVGPIQRVLVPLEGTAESSDAVSAALRRFTDAGVDVIALHVFDVNTVPRFWDQMAHAGNSYASDFEARWCAVPAADVRLRRGVAPATIIEVADDQDVDLIALGWAQNLAAGRAAIVRAVLAHTIPVLLVPVGETRDDTTRDDRGDPTGLPAP